MFDVDAPRAVVVAVLVVVNLALVGSLATSAAAYSPYSGAWDGADTLRETAGENATVRVSVSAGTYDEVRADESLGVVLAPPDPEGGATAPVTAFLARGGTLVVAGQNPSATNAYLSAVGADARVDGRTVRDPDRYYRGSSLPVATNVSDHPLTAGVGSLTLNDGTVVRPRGATPLVATSPGAYLDANGNAVPENGEPLGSFPVATVEPVGAGQVVVVGDPSVFTNAMLDRSGNRAFLAALLAGRSAVVLDYSASTALPPLAYAVLAVRASPVAQSAVGAAAFVGLALWVGRDSLVGAIQRVVGHAPDEGPGDTVFDEASVAALLTERHPEWERDRVERVTEAILRQRGRGEDDD